ncbi:MAG: hypothetical protein ACJ74O_19765 [Frankiaceae bacterium]
MRSNLLRATLGLYAVSFIMTMLVVGEPIHLHRTVAGALVESWLDRTCFWLGTMCAAAFLLEVVLEHGRRE